MNLKGIISSTDNGLFKVFIKEKSYLSNLLPKCLEVGEIAVGDEVVVAFFDNNLSAGAITGILKKVVV
ncbi:hypothetical protein [Cellulosilyticum sp. I15G10I2]|uniref:hypothetical protein n=1 Tax=Cellulosilyticum sp. I15G10I2 TaxID=1892843 RepID=UPI00085C2A4E|nr:hypothetical protein [Cellulosilyticum sp. I15G10I2]